MVSRPIQRLIGDLVDYAGLFPPAGLDMETAVAHYARHLHGPDSWILARFIVPAGRLDAFEQALERSWRADDGPWRLSVLVGDDPAAGRRALDTAAVRLDGLATVEAVESRAADVEAIARQAEVFPDVELFVELPAGEDPRPAMAALAEHAAGRPQRLAAKIRTGSVRADEIPSVGEVVHFVRAAAEAGVAFKATAGLHHPVAGDYALTYDPAPPHGRMHGFLTLFLAAAWAQHGGPNSSELKELLAEPHASTLDFSSVGVSWRGHRLSADEIAHSRTTFARSFGSCSFAEPVDDLRALHLI
ncbi:MAG: hypothetical protein AAGN46_17625 [Acidobacteriota bacterium]